MPSSDQGASSSLSSPITFAAENSSESSVGRVPGIAAPAIPGTLDTSAEDAAVDDEPTFAKVVRVRTLRGTGGVEPQSDLCLRRPSRVRFLHQRRVLLAAGVDRHARAVLPGAAVAAQHRSSKASQ